MSLDPALDTRDCFADEVAIDFPSIRAVVGRIRAAFLGRSAPSPVLHAEVWLSAREACRGATVRLDVPIRAICPMCGGRGETWMESCAPCGGSGHSFVPCDVRLAVPPGVGHGARFHVSVATHIAPPTLVEVRVAVR